MNFLKKWYTYQKERFPVVMFGLYIFCIVFAVFCFSYISNEILMHSYKIWLETPSTNNIEWIKIIPMFIVAFLQFLMVRITDEFKDYEEDCKYRPYRPVPRGLITLKELKILFIICAILQVLITFMFNRGGLILLAIVWAFSGLLSKDFFIKKVLDKHMLFGVFLDEMLMPILVLYLSSYIIIPDMCMNALIFSNLGEILLISYLVSWAVEIARKIRCKEDEEEGVKTYTAVFGIGKATLILIILETLLMLLQIKVLGKAHLPWIIGIYVLTNIINLLFVKKKSKKLAKMTELSANIYIIIVYLSMGLLII